MYCSAQSIDHMEEAAWLSHAEPGREKGAVWLLLNVVSCFFKCQLPHWYFGFCTQSQLTLARTALRTGWVQMAQHPPGVTIHRGTSIHTGVNVSLPLLCCWKKISWFVSGSDTCIKKRWGSLRYVKVCATGAVDLNGCLVLFTQCVKHQAALNSPESQLHIVCTGAIKCSICIILHICVYTGIREKWNFTFHIWRKWNKVDSDFKWCKGNTSFF